MWIGTIAGAVFVAVGVLGAAAPAAAVPQPFAAETVEEVAVRLLVEAGTPRRVAADVISGLVRAPRNELYRGSLQRPD